MYTSLYYEGNVPYTAPLQLASVNRYLPIDWDGIIVITLKVRS